MIVSMVGILLVYVAGVISGHALGSGDVYWPLSILAMLLALGGGFLSQTRRMP
jgi:hypothetical protein